MDLKLLGIGIGVVGTALATILPSGIALVAMLAGISGFGLTAYDFLKKKKEPFKPEDPYSFHWRPIIILAIVVLVIIFLVVMHPW